MASEGNINEEIAQRNIQPNIRLDWRGITSEKIRSLKVSRGATKGVLTKKRNELNELMKDFQNVEKVKANISTLDTLMENFRTAHKEYHDLLTDEVDIEESLEYFEAEERRVESLNRTINEWFETVSSLSKSLKPEDSISNAAYSRHSKSHSRSSVSSRRSCRSTAVSSISAKTKAAAKKAMLQAEVSNLQRSFSLKQEEIILEQKRKVLELETEIAKAAAKEQIYADAEARERDDFDDYWPRVVSPHVTQNPSLKPIVKPEIIGDPGLQPIIKPEIIGDPGLQPIIKPEIKGNPGLQPIVKPEVTGIPGFEQTTKSTKKQLNPCAEEFHKIDRVKDSSNNIFLQQMMLTQQQQNNKIQLLLEQQQQHTLALTLPQPEIPIFNGDPIEYCNFTRAFENLIERKTLSGSSRLYYLVQYTSGDVKELMRSCLTMEGESGYQEARRLLKTRYGQSYKIATSYVDKLTQGPQIKADDGAALQKFSIMLTSCKNTLREIGYLSKVENPESLKSIVKRLPFGLRSKWRDIADRITEKKNREVNIEDIAEFVAERARAATHPVFGDISDKKSTTSSNIKDKGLLKRTAFATNSNPQSSAKVKESSSVKPRVTGIKCPLCEAGHWLSQCEDFKKMRLEDRLKFVRKANLCNNCLVEGHFARSCSKTSFCKVNDCSERHSTFLHQKVKPSQDNSRQIGEHRAEGQVNNGFVNVDEDLNKFTGAGSPRIGMAILPVKVRAEGSNRIVKTYAFIDSGSNTTFCTNELLNQLQVKGTKTAISLTTMQNSNTKVDSSVISLQVFDLNEECFIELPTVFSTTSIPVSVGDIPRQRDVDRWQHLKGVHLPAIDAQIGLLIGSDVPKALEPKEVRKSCNGGPFATRISLGWVVNGPLQRGENKTHTSNLIHADKQLSQQFEMFCKMEFNDSVTDVKPAMSVEDKCAISTYDNSAKLLNGHYEIALPWKRDSPELPNNKFVAVHRLNLLKRKLMKDPSLHEKYSDFMQDLLEKGYAEKVPGSEIKREDGKVWYLPHHSVEHPQKPDKTRVVFDCAARYKGTSLNDQVLQGPDLTNNLVGVLIRFREESVALMADVEAMFHQVRVLKDDVDVLRFLWFPDNDLEKEPEEYRMLVHLFGGVWSPSCANYALQRTAKDNECHFVKEATDAVKNDFYVDDCLKSVESEGKAIRLVEQLREVLKCGGFRLTKWLSNRRSVLESIPVSERAKGVMDLNLDRDKLPIERALGVYWDVESDKFILKIKIKNKPASRRGLLSIVSSVYDPIGFVSPFILRAKLILQELCRRKLHWDDIVPEECLINWNRWLKELSMLDQFTINRCFKTPGFGKVAQVQLHHFADASEIGYGAVSYIRFKSEEEEVCCSFVLGKSRLAPMKSMTIPRLELAAATIAVRLDTIIRNELSIGIDSSTFWTDSTTVLQYINNQHRRFNTFVANRLTTILDVSSPNQWRHIDGKLNPADDASRGLSVDVLLEENRWINGPKFLIQCEENWPTSALVVTELEDDDPEVKRREVSNYLIVQKTTSVTLDEIILRFSLWSKLRKFAAWMLRYRSRLLDACRRRRSEAMNECAQEEIPPISVHEMEMAEKQILKYVQSKCFADELRDLATSKSQQAAFKGMKKSSYGVKRTSDIFKLDPVLRNGLLCVGGRLRNAPISEGARSPVIIPKNHHIGTLIIRHYHVKSGHSGLEYCLSLIRELFWIIGGRVGVKKALDRCFSCRKRQAPLGEQKMSDLPVDRVTPSKPPFTFVGVDCFGPFEVKRGRSLVKRYGVLFTCLSIRAIHIEVAHSMDTSSFIGAMRRFISRRGEPEKMRSDNGGNFVAGERELREAVENWNQQVIHESLLQRNIQWTFNPPAGSHHGGVWERCIRTVRKVINAVLKEQILDDEGLLTLMCEVESIVNGRPITKVSDDHRDVQALTPNHLLLLRSGPVVPPGVFQKEHSYSRRRWCQVQYMANVFWKRWIREYLPSLQKRQKWTQPHRNFAVGDVVLVLNDAVPRSKWPLGRITQVYYNKQDGHVRSVTLKTCTSVLDRPIDKIVLLEAVEAMEAD